MNLILFKQEELGKPLPKRDDRTIHLVKVLHKAAGDTFGAGILNGPLGQGRILSIEPDGSIQIELQLDKPAPRRHPLRTAVGFPRPIQLRRLLRDLSSLGVSNIDLLATELGEKSYQDTTLLTDGGAEQALIEGAIQSRDTTLPVISTYPSLKAWLNARPWEPMTSLLLAPDNVHPQGSLADLPCTPGAAAVLVVGSERGWSEQERAQLEAAGFMRLSMGSRALRTETACVAAVILALEKIGALR
ncbi:16S rRNA (uracil(1498)-N(3))-methyltransferase [Gracilinema caldarium]|uniref:Ribosomal RNA small subunit methyltransferase E n=1 Tax=Gracilinema caldarium (strain ATCC 51460 / DSM 7334 / H1) TaxID=744872 RepID=F8EZX9_GRAC1|nr:RsmE family RNA methyltransferase [Gracilinema caldarium]AEJ18492.1 Ribosomal RNA small subunit methyltransferase E [Gracilinema caldarium DSM 7334]